MNVLQWNNQWTVVNVISLVCVSRAILKSLPFGSCLKWSNTPLSSWAGTILPHKTPIPKILYCFDRYVDIFLHVIADVFTGNLSVRLEVLSGLCNSWHLRECWRRGRGVVAECFSRTMPWQESVSWWSLCFKISQNKLLVLHYVKP